MPNPCHIWANDEIPTLHVGKVAHPVANPNNPLLLECKKWDRCSAFLDPDNS